jgi:hypothetical protein
VLMLGSAALRVFYLAYNCPLDLAPDEAHYWDWSRHLDWSYYSKGPLVAWLIRISDALAGTWAQGFPGGEMLAVRLPAVICGALLLVSVYVLTNQVFGREPLALAVVAVALTLPVVAAGSSLMTIDSPYTCCWGWALVFGHRAIFGGSRWGWPAAGLMVGLGILAKYTMVLWLPSVGLFLLASSDRRRLFVSRGFWIMTGVAVTCSVPIVWWNIAHDWVSFRHVQGLAGLQEDAGIRWLGPVVYIGTQCGLFLVFWFIVWAAAMVVHRPWRKTDPGVQYLWWMSAPMFAVFLAFSFKTGGGEPNWPVTAYISGLVLAAPWLVRQLASPHVWFRRCVAANLVLTCTAGVILTVGAHHSDWMQPVLVRIAGAPTPQRPQPLRRVDPTCRLRGWRRLAAEVDRLRTELRQDGTEPIIACTNWSLPGEIGFYCQGHPPVYSIGLAFGDRHSQYDFWRPNPVSDPRAFVGRTFILVGDAGLEILRAFDRVEVTPGAVYSERGQPIAQWSVFIGRGYRGLGEIAAPQGVQPF